MLPIEIVRKIMLYNIHPLAVVMKYYILEHEIINSLFELDHSFQDYIFFEEPFMFLTKPVAIFP